jgi:hypothetical protein
MKKFSKYLFTFLVGAGLATGVIFVSHPNVVLAQHLGTQDWTLQTFEKINSELPRIVGDRSLLIAVVPCSSGYEIIGTDLSVFSLFRRPWERPLRLIDARMTALRSEAEAEQAVTPNGP